jgi:hypothetical protein
MTLLHILWFLAFIGFGWCLAQVIRFFQWLRNTETRVKSLEQQLDFANSRINERAHDAFVNCLVSRIRELETKYKQLTVKPEQL